MGCLWFALSIVTLPSHTQHIPHGLCSLPLSRSGHMGVGVQGEACGEVAQHAADGFDIHTVLQSEGGEGVP